MKIDNLKYRAIIGLLKFIALFPLRVLYLVSDIACFILHRVVGYRVEIVRSNLSRAFPEKTAGELRKIENAFYRHLCDVFVEAIKLLHISDAEMKRRVKVEGVELVNEAVVAGKSVVLMLGHYGNWEWVTASAPYMDHRAVIGDIYHPLLDKAFDRVMLKLRSRFHTENIPMSKSVRRLLGINRAGGQFVCGFIADQRPFTPELKYWTEFLGIDTAYVNGGEVIGCKIGAEFLYCEMMPQKRGYYKLSFTKLERLDDGEENPYTKAYFRKLESTIRSNPPYWLWSHNRWKRTRSKALHNN